MRKNSCSIVFTGDIGFDRYMDGKYDFSDLLSDRIIDFCTDADHVVANVEGACIDAEDSGHRGTFFHCMDPKATKILKKIHADVWNIGNNHIMDAGKEGLVSTLKIATKLGYRTIGAGLTDCQASDPVYMDEAGGIGMFGVAYMPECVPATATDPGVFRWDDMDRIAARIKEIKKKCRWCIIVSHGGEEFSDMPNPYTRDRYLKYLKLGADIVVAHHPHVPENYELFDNKKAVFYSLGNFIFDTDYQRVHAHTDIGVLLKLILSEEELKFEALGTKLIRGDERIEETTLPAIFTNISASEFVLLSPLAAAAFVKEERKKMIYLEPERFANASEDVWNAYFFSTEPDGYDKGAHMDLSVIVPYAATAESGSWKKSSLDEVKKYIMQNGAGLN